MNIWTKLKHKYKLEYKRETFSTKEVEGKYTKYKIWKEVPENHIPTEEYINKRVYIAGYLKSDKFFLKGVHFSGEKYWPEDGYSVIDSYGQERSFLKQEVRLHPIEYIKRRVKKKIVFKKKIRLSDINDNIKTIKKLKKKIKKK